MKTPICLLSILLSFVFFLGGCQNSRMAPNTSSSKNLTSKTIFGEGEHLKDLNSLENKITSVIFDDTKDLALVSIAAGDSSTSSQNFEQKALCDINARARNTCQCQFEWNELVNGKNYTRSSKTQVTEVVHNLVSCGKPIPLVNQKIAEGTTLLVSLHSSPGSEHNFSLDAFGVKVGDLSTQLCGGKLCLNKIARYSCHETVQRGRHINNWLNRYNYQETNNGTTTEQRLYQASGTRFCFQDYNTHTLLGDSANNTDGECAALPATKKERTTAIQNYYYNLYIREDDTANIITKNSLYSCPKINKSETLRKTQNDHWPLDVTFSLSQYKSAEFNVPVIAASKLGLNSTNIQSNTQCGEDSKKSPLSGTNTPNTAIANHCLGWALKPLSNGSCPLYTDESGKSKQSFRLRRYGAQYPHSYNTNGNVIPQVPALDVVYVIDRPVLNPEFPSKSTVQYFSMRGPKPCPFAYLDWYGADVSKTKGYFSTNDPRWDGINVEGIHLPNADYTGTPELQRACAATLPVTQFDSLGNIIGLNLATTSSSNTKSIALIQDGTIPANKPSAYAVSLGKTYLRPGTPWAPHYVEDTEFEACAPLPEGSDFKDAPLHITHTDEGNFSWCAAPYPTRNPNPITGVTTTNTTAGIKGQKLSTSSYDCNSEGCHRTAVPSITGGEDTRFPLQAKPADIEKMLLTDSSYRCEITFDLFKSKSHLKQSPNSGCCGSNVLNILNPNTIGESAYIPPLKSGIQPQSFGLGCGTPSY